MTTNHADALDPALLRPGRIDYKLYLGAAGAAQQEELYRRFFPAAHEADARWFARAHEAETMAECQGRLLRLEEEDGWAVCEKAEEPRLEREPGGCETAEEMVEH